MRKVFRRFAIWICVASVALFAALWLRGLLRKDQVCVPIGSGGVVVISHPHHLQITWAKTLLPALPGSWKTWDTPIPARLEYLEVRVTRHPNGWALWLPHWLPMLLLSAVPAWAWMMQRRRRDRKIRGLCTHCGYDLRASGDRCPECGTAVEASASIPWRL